MTRKHSEKIYTIIVAAIWIAVWQLGAMLVNNELLLPGPLATIKTLGGLAITKVFYMNIAWTVMRCFIAMIVSFFAGAVFAWFSYRSYWMRKITSLPVGFFKAVPVMAIVIYVILVAKADWVAIIVCFLMCFPIVYTNVLSGLEAVSGEYIELAKICRLSTGQRLKHIYLPGILPQIKAAISLIAGLSWKAVVAAEILSVPKYSLGYEMMNAKYYLQTPTLFAYILVIVVLSMAFERLIKSGLEGLDWKAYKGSKLRLVKARESAAAYKADTGSGSAGSDCGFSYADSEDAGETPGIFLKGVSKSFDGKPVLDNFDLVVGQGKVTALMGPSGRGKTTIARILAGLETAYSGYVSAPDNVAFLFQEDRLLPWLNVRDNIALGRLGRGVDVSARKNITENGSNKGVEEAARERIRQLAADLEISETLDMLPGELSGGMKHRVAMARTFFADGDMVILDEPFRGLDVGLKERIINRLWIRETTERRVLLITHVLEDAERLADIKILL